ncbi:HD domain-containing protein [Patescibacteria group bacterium]|nr:HD domain-containing protein [Patescibacteria group bacterium]
MNYQKWEKILIKEIWRLWDKSDKFLPCHGPEHHIRVWKNAEKFGLKKKADMGVLLASCLLHDVVAYNQSSEKGHDLASAKMAIKILQKIKFPQAKIKLVEENIMLHRTKKQVGKNLEGAIMKSFDKIDCFGATGVYRIITPITIRKWGIKKCINYFLHQGHIKAKWEAIVFPELKKKYKKDYQYTVDYFKQLAKELGL